MRFAQPVTDEETLRIFQQCKTRLKVRRDVKLYECSRLAAPILTGIFKIRIILPKTLRRPLVCEHLFLHELAHLRRHDILSTLAMSLFCAVYWFNPLVWLAARLMSNDAEEAADQLALAGSSHRERTAYGNLLLEFAECFCTKTPLPGYVGLGVFTPAFSSSQLSRRIEMIQNHKKWNRFAALLAVGLSLGVCITVLTRFHYVAAWEVTGNSSVEPVQDDTLVKINLRVILPEGESTSGIHTTMVGLGKSGWNSQSNYINLDGTFSNEMPQNGSYLVGVFDTKNRFAAPLRVITVGGESPTETLEFPMEPGIEFSAKFLDQATSEPIPGLEICLAQLKGDARDRKAVSFDKPSDENGLFQARLLPGQYVVSVNHRWHRPDDIRKGVYAREFTVKGDEKSITHEFQIPSPFVGKVVLPDGTPARNRSVIILDPRMTKPGIFTETDSNGIFRSVEPLVNVTVEIPSYHPLQAGQYFAWFGNELAQVKEREFQLVASSTVKGRLLDARTGEPLSGQLFFYWQINPADSRQKAFMPRDQKTDANGEFAISLNPTLKYELFIVYGRTSDHGGGPYDPRIELGVIEPKGDLDLGDLVVDSEKAVLPR